MQTQVRRVLVSRRARQQIERPRRPKSLTGKLMDAKRFLGSVDNPCEHLQRV